MTAGRAQAAPAQPAVERPDRAAVIAVDAEHRRRARQRAQAVVGEDVRFGQSRGNVADDVGLERVGPQQPAQLRTRAGYRPVGIDEHDLGQVGARSPGRASDRGVGATRRRRSAGPARAARQRSRPACPRRRAAVSDAVPSGRSVPPPLPSVTGSIASRQPWWVRPPRSPPACRISPSPRSSSPAIHCAAARQFGSSSAVRSGSATAASSDDEPGRRVGRAVVAERAGWPADERLGWFVAELVPDLARRLEGAAVVRASLLRRQRAQRRVRNVRTRRQHLQRGDQRVASEQRVEPARIVSRDRQRRCVRPTFVGAGRRQGRRPAAASHSWPGVVFAICIRNS